MGAERFWENTSLDAMSDTQWEALCDRCGLCCLHKLEDEDTGDLYFTNVSCKLYNSSKACCDDYERRRERVEHCLAVRDMPRQHYHWLPKSCAYRLISQGDPLPVWHPLVSGRAESVHEAGVSIVKWAISEKQLPTDIDWESHVISDDDMVC